MSTAYWCVLAAAVLPYLTVAIAKSLGSYDNAKPRAPETYPGIAGRAHGAHQNGFEAFPFFAVAVLVASGGASHAVIAPLNMLALAWIAARLAYIAAYLADRATLRSLVWFVTFGLTIAIFTMPAWNA